MAKIISTNSDWENFRGVKVTSLQHHVFFLKGTLKYILNIDNLSHEISQGYET